MALTALLAVKVKIKTLTAGNRGFTLLELLLVLFIMGLSAAVVMSSGSRMQEKSMFNAEARKLYLTVKHAREISIIERMNIVFKVDKEAKKYWIAYEDDKTSETHSIPQKLTIEGEDIIFFPKGNSSGGRIEIGNEKGQKYEVTVDQVFGTPSVKRL
jgi:prepilin-type N-terminal cleavage/methylation domain-containing protein